VKATQAKAQQGLPELPPRTCEVCGKKTTKPYGLTRRGCICSRECQEAQTARWLNCGDKT